MTRSRKVYVNRLLRFSGSGTNDYLVYLQQLERSRCKFKRFAAKYEREIQQVSGRVSVCIVACNLLICFLLGCVVSAIEKSRSCRTALMRLRSCPPMRNRRDQDSPVRPRHHLQVDQEGNMMTIKARTFPYYLNRSETAMIVPDLECGVD